MQAKAEAKYVRISPRKVKPIADLVRGKNVDEAMAILKFTPNKGAKLLSKVVHSAKHNATNNHNMDESKLFISKVYANQGPTMKRWKAGSKGMANPFKHRMSHIGVVIEERQ